MNLNPITFMLLAQVIIFILGWPLEWTEIIIIFVPIFLPMVQHFGIDPILFGVLIALNLQTAFLSPPMAMSAYYLKGVSPPSLLLTQIFSGCMPFVYVVILSMVLVYVFPQIALWLPQVLYSR
jgi:TRAP-type mannitol/chloroaromatic compound transport system permease large subunit